MQTFDPVAMAFESIRHQLELRPELAALMRILSGVQRKAEALPPCDLFDLDLRALRDLKALAMQTLAQLDPEQIDSAVESAAEVLCAGRQQEYRALSEESSRVQLHYRRWAQSIIHAYEATLEGR